MKELAQRYAAALFSFGVDASYLHKCQTIFKDNPPLFEALKSPVVQKTEKYAIIEKVFDREIVHFLSVLCDHNRIDLIDEICAIYDELVLASENVLTAELSYAFLPSKEELNRIKMSICSKYNKSDVVLQMKEDKTLIGGFVLKIGDNLYDKSIKASLTGLKRDLEVK